MYNQIDYFLTTPAGRNELNALIAKYSGPTFNENPEEIDPDGIYKYRYPYTTVIKYGPDTERLYIILAEAKELYLKKTPDQIIADAKELINSASVKDYDDYIAQEIEIYNRVLEGLPELHRNLIELYVKNVSPGGDKTLLMAHKLIEKTFDFDPNKNGEEQRLKMVDDVVNLQYKGISENIRKLKSKSKKNLRDNLQMFLTERSRFFIEITQGTKLNQQYNDAVTVKVGLLLAEILPEKAKLFPGDVARVPMTQAHNLSRLSYKAMSRDDKDRVFLALNKIKHNNVYVLENRPDDEKHDVLIKQNTNGTYTALLLPVFNGNAKTTTMIMKTNDFLSSLTYDQNAIFDGENKKDFLSFNVQDVINLGIWTRKDDAINGLYLAMSYIQNTLIYCWEEEKGKGEKGKIRPRVTKSMLGSIFYQIEIDHKTGDVKVYINNKLPAETIKTYFHYSEQKPLYSYGLKSNAYILFDVIDSIVALPHYRAKVSKNEILEIPLERIRAELMLPDPADTGKPKEKIKDPIIQAVREINNADKINAETYGKNRSYYLYIDDRDDIAFKDWIKGSIAVKFTGDKLKAIKEKKTSYDAIKTQAIKKAQRNKAKSKTSGD